MRWCPQRCILKTLCYPVYCLSAVEHGVLVLCVQGFQRVYQSAHIGADTAHAVLSKTGIDANVHSADSIAV